MTIPSQSLPQIPSFLRFVTAFEVIVVLVAAVGLFFLPVPARELWAWSAAPFNSRQMGAIYFAALLPLLILALNGRWDGGRAVLWMIFSFTGVVMLAMLIHSDKFQWARVSTWGFWFLYLFLPVNSAIYLYRLRNWPITDAVINPPGLRQILNAIALAAGLYGLALFLFPGPATSFWPWPVDAFHGRMYSSALIAPAVSAWVARQRSSPAELRILGAALILLGGMTLAGLVWTSNTVAPERRANFAALSTWAFVALQLLTMVAGAALLSLGHPQSGMRSTGAGGTVPLVRWFALAMGVAFTIAAISGFVPGLTTTPPSGAPVLHLDLSHGYLLGLFPINVVHNLFHLAIGLGGIYAWRRTALSLRFAQIAAITLGILSLMGFGPPANTMFGYMPVHGHDVWLHGLEALLAAYLGFVAPKPSLIDDR